MYESKINHQLFVYGYIDVRRRQWHPTPVLLPRKSQGRRSLVGCSPWGPEESDTTERLHFHFSLSSIGEGNGNPLQCSCLENPRDGGAWWAAICGVAQSRTRLKWLSSSSLTLLFPCVLDSKESACSAGDLSSIPGLGRYPGEGNGNPLQYSCLENCMDRGAWQATVHEVVKCQTHVSPWWLTLSLSNNLTLRNTDWIQPPYLSHREIKIWRWGGWKPRALSHQVIIELELEFSG